MKAQRPFDLQAIVILPDHLHCLWRLPEGDADFSTRWRLIKTRFSKSFGKSANQRGEKEIWQRRFWEHQIQDETDWRNHMDYIHFNPVKHGLVQRAADWPFSSFHRAVERGWYPEDWGEVEPDAIADWQLE